MSASNFDSTARQGTSHQEEGTKTPMSTGEKRKTRPEGEGDQNKSTAENNYR